MMGLIQQPGVIFIGLAAIGVIAFVVRRSRR
jgi:cbb3-type cytochrome oxidase subunit 3